MTHLADRYIRQLGWYDPTDRQDRVTFVGVGGIGSFAALGAAKLGIPNITLIDPDTVEEHNQPNQLYSIHDVGDAKVDALEGWLHMHDEFQSIEGINGLGEEQRHNGVVVSGLDSMEARTKLWRDAIRMKPQVPLYIDARLGGQIIVIYAVNPTNLRDVEKYESTLYSDADAEDAPCTERGVVDVGLQVGAAITRMLRLHFNGEAVDRITQINQETLTAVKGDWYD